MTPKDTSNIVSPATPSPQSSPPPPPSSSSSSWALQDLLSTTVPSYDALLVEMELAMMQAYPERLPHPVGTQRSMPGSMDISMLLPGLDGGAHRRFDRREHLLAVIDAALAIIDNDEADNTGVYLDRDDTNLPNEDVEWNRIMTTRTTTRRLAREDSQLPPGEQRPLTRAFLTRRDRLSFQGRPGGRGHNGSGDNYSRSESQEQQ